MRKATAELNIEPRTERFELPLSFAPWRLSGVVLGVLMNDRRSLDALGAAATGRVHKALPRAPVLYIKPRNTHAPSGSAVAVPHDPGQFEIGASLAAVIGRSACAIPREQALSYVAGWTLVADLSLPQQSYYRPNARFKARDGSCLIGPIVVPAERIASPDAAALTISIDTQPIIRLSNTAIERPIARLIADVSEFMTLHPGDVVMLGVAAGAPCARAGQRFRIDYDPIGRLEGRLVAEPGATR
jgi:5-oxopent-3-ene-1,2,5-tricarboxylate decarboxylase / 2-hydroxyhepta-2,4-diene-1,7-dioate isomerase